MARQTVITGFPFAFVLNETGSRQDVVSGVVVNETSGASGVNVSITGAQVTAQAGVVAASGSNIALSIGSGPVTALAGTVIVFLPSLRSASAAADSRTTFAGTNNRSASAVANTRTAFATTNNRTTSAAASSRTARVPSGG